MFDIGKLSDSNNRSAILLLNILSGVALFVAAIWFSYSLFSTRDEELPVRIVNSITLEPTILLAGKPFYAHVNVTLNRLCPYEVHWSLVRQSDGVEILRIVEPVKQPPEQIGKQDLPPVERYVPSAVLPGKYKYLAEVFDLCQGKHTVTPARSNVDITVH